MAEIIQTTTTAATGDWFPINIYEGTRSTVQSSITGTGAVSATVVIEVTSDLIYPALTLGTITLSGTNSDSGGITMDATWRYIRSRCTAIAGTSASVTTVFNK